MNGRASEFSRQLTSIQRPALPRTAPRWRRQIFVFLISTVACLLFLTFASYNWISVQKHRRLSLLREQASASQPSDATVLSIPRIKLQARILNPEQKSFPSTPGETQPDAKRPGSPIIAGQGDRLFGRIHELQIGDEIVVIRKRKEYHYSVQSKAIVDTKNLTAPQPASEDRLMLVTSYPPHAAGPAAHRLIIVAALQKLISIPVEENRE